VTFRGFLDAPDYWFGYSDTYNTEGHNPARERFTVGIGDVVDGTNVMGAAMEKTPDLGMSCVSDQIKYEDGMVITNAWNIEHLSPFYS
jgi:hypothetical protein